jgi:hypothetical protein
VLTLIIEAYVSNEDTVAAFEEAGLVQYAYAHDPRMPWPTLGELVARNQRLVVLSDEGGEPDWHMNVWDHAFETPFHAVGSGDLVCEAGRGSPDNALFILNHFLTDPIAFESLAEQVNLNPFFIDRARECEAHFQHVPNFPTVDFYEIGNLFQVVSALNQ